MFKNVFNGGATVPHPTIEAALEEAQFVLRADASVDFVDIFEVGSAVPQSRVTRRSVYERDGVHEAVTIPNLDPADIIGRLN